MIEIYIDNHERPAEVEETVNRLGIAFITIEHADSVTCLQLAGAIEVNSLHGLTVLHQREIQ